MESLADLLTHPHTLTILWVIAMAWAAVTWDRRRGRGR